MRLILLALLALSLQANTVYVIETKDYLGKLSIENGNVVVIPRRLPINTPKGIVIVKCTNKKCINYTVNKYKYMGTNYVK